MLSEDTIDMLMEPIIKRQENINLYILNLIAERIEQIGRLLPSDINRLERLYKTGSDVHKINKYLADMTGLQVRDIKQLIKIVAHDSYQDCKPFYDYRHKEFIPFNKNKPLQRVVNAIANQTANTYINLSKSQAFMIRDLANPKILKPTSLSKTYQTIIDEAVQASQSGIIDYNTAMRRSLNQLIDSGIRYVTYNTESGRTYTQRLDTAVRRNILDGIRMLNQKVQEEVGEEFGADGVEISVHPHSALDHEPVQGHQFTNEEFDKLQTAQPFTDVDGTNFSAIDRAIGTLNCRHFAWSIIIGVSKPLYTKKQLQEFIEENHKGYTDSKGKYRTLYECAQEQRRLETLIRKAKEGQIIARTAGDRKLAVKYQLKVNKYVEQYNQFSDACGLMTRPDKMRVSSYRKITTNY